MSKSNHRRNSSVKVRTVSPHARSMASSPATLGLQVARQLVTLLGGSGSGNGNRGGLGIPFLGAQGADPSAQAITELTRALTAASSTPRCAASGVEGQAATGRAPVALADF